MEDSAAAAAPSPTPAADAADASAVGGKVNVLLHSWQTY